MNDNGYSKAVRSGNFIVDADEDEMRRREKEYREEDEDVEE